jgi:hypothetical protein
MPTNVKICLCPFEPNLAVAGSLLIAVSPPYTDESVTVELNPKITKYTEGDSGGGVQIAQLTVQQSSDETIRINLHIANHPEQTLSYDGHNYTIRLMRISTEKREGQDFRTFEFFVDESELREIQMEGTFSCRISAPDADWPSNSREYRFPPVTGEGILVQVVKDTKRTLHVCVNGPLGQSIVFREDTSTLVTPKLHIALTWKDSTLELYLNGKLTQKRQI